MRTLAVSKLDIFNPQMEEYFMEKVSKLTPEELVSIPQEIRNKLFRSGFQRSSHDMKFNEKAHLLTTTFNQDMIIMFLDEEKGIGPDEFKAAIKAQKGKITNGELLKNIPTKSIFILGNKELMAPLLYLNHVLCSDIYNLVSTPVAREKTSSEKNYIKFYKAYKGITEVFTHYEGTKKMISQAFGIDMPSWYALLYFGNKERLGTDFYNGHFKYAYSSSRIKLFTGLKKMYDNGYIARRGQRNKLKYTLTAKGTDLLNRIIDTVILNYKTSGLS